MNILVIRTHRLGDILQLTPMLKGLKERYPESNVSFVVGKNYAGLLEGNPDVDEIIPFPENEYRHWLKNDLKKFPFIFNETYSLVHELKRKDPTMIINRQYEWGAILAELIGADTILGGTYSPERGLYFKDQASRDFFHLIRNDRRSNRKNLVDWACRIAGVHPGPNKRMAFYVSRVARREAERLLSNHAVKHEESLIAVQMGAARSFRQWGVQNFAEVIRWLMRRKEKRVVLVGSEDETDLWIKLGQILSHQQSKPINLIGKTSLQTLGAVLERCDCLITGDTGSMHVAAAVGTPVLALFFGTACPWETGPYGPDHLILYSHTSCSPCFDPKDCQAGYRCKKRIRAETVVRAFETAEAFWRDERPYWESDSDNVDLFVTARGKNGEQILVPVDGNRCVVDRIPQRSPTERGQNVAGPKVILEKGEEVIRLFLRGETEQGFLNFAQYLDHWLEAKDSIIDEHAAIKESFSELLRGCIEAMQSQDIVTLMDAIEYGFKPLIQPFPIAGQQG